MITCLVMAAVVALFVVVGACYQLSSPAGGTAYPGASSYGTDGDGDDDDAGGDGGGEA
ncbi:hypothetical protein FB565_008802 [Actinoplanes lutulentus]|uniref:Uncharacterized protein n=1 Tax=Actinoplanes lutulentus TaxID=1287878 RepID=A0A327YXA1_9ACTN|nr:hypothetical protein [Actinoplanes lutulentus]MBB2949016.1 hypothetical protein [Actinoplanes lutulentus]RAK26206.1 hypothetical protein B0I29_12838 [Actinoplanes lutulentus]